LAQTAGIVAGVFFTGRNLRSDLRSRRITDQLTLTQLHRDLWGRLQDDPQLLRIFEQQPALGGLPVTQIEREFLNSVFVHYINGWMVARDGGLLTIEALAIDARTFFRRPIPNTVWNETKQRYDPKFVAFIEGCLKER
jgi:hypothetical protein